MSVSTQDIKEIAGHNDRKWEEGARDWLDFYENFLGKHDVAAILAVRLIPIIELSAHTNPSLSNKDLCIEVDLSFS